MTPDRPVIAPGDLVKISVDGQHFEVGLAIEAEPDQVGFWHVFSRGRILLIAEWDITLLAPYKLSEETI